MNDKINSPFIVDYKITPYVMDVPTITRLSYPAGYEWMRTLHDSNLPVEAKIQIINNYHNNLIMDKVIDYELKQKWFPYWILPILTIFPVALYLIVKVLL